MSKSGYKFLFVSENDILIYLYNLSKKKKINIKKNNLRLCTVNRWNYKFLYNIHQGKYARIVLPSLYHFSYKLGMLIKTRKPFFFRSKKKKR